MRGACTIVFLVVAAGFTSSAARASPQEEARRVLERFGGEPSVAEVQRHAVRASRLGAEESDSWRDRVNVAPLLPELRVRAYHALDRDESLALEPGSPDRFDLDAGVGWRVEGRATWELSRLVWDPDEVSIGREAATRGRHRQELVALVARLFFERRRLQVTLLLAPPATSAEAAEMAIAIEERTAALDGLTGGWYGAELRRRGRR